MMLKSTLKVDTAKLDQLDCTNKLSKYELKVIKEVTDILSPFEMMTEKCQAQNEVTAGLIIPCVQGLKEEMKEMQDTFNSKMVSTLLASLEKRMKKYEEMPSLQIASALDPKFKLEDRSQKKKIMFLHSKNKASRKGYKGECYSIKKMLRFQPYTIVATKVSAVCSI